MDNPNVWYELGFAFASGKDVVMITEERQKFPFDIQHRQVINYKTNSKSDYEKLEFNITEKIRALLFKQKSVIQIIENPVKEREGLRQHELTMLLMIIENQLTNEDTVSVYSLKNDLDKAGFNAIATSISVRELQRKEFIETFKEYSDFNNQEYLACRLTKKVKAGLWQTRTKLNLKNQSKMTMNNLRKTCHFKS